MKKRLFWRTAGILLLMTAVGGSAPAPDSQAQSQQAGLGTVHFPVSCNSAAQASFDQGMVLQHSFAHAAASVEFNKALQQDPTCAMADWGLALASLNNPFLTPTQAGRDEANRLLDKAEHLGAKSPREVEYITALRTLVGKCQWDACTTAFSRALEQLAAHYPDDSEAQIVYALGLLLAAPDDDLTFENQRKAAAILEEQSRRHPDHPGVAHYLIHAYDTPLHAYDGSPSASMCLAAAQSYTQIAPESPHALHMPSHIFTRLGRWDDSIASNLKSIAAREDNTPNDKLHAMDYLVYAYLQTGRSKAARSIQNDSTIPENHPDPGHLAGPFAVAAIDARLALETSDWNAAASLRVIPSDQFPHVEAMTHYARALGFVRSGRPEAARPELAALATLEEKLHAGGNTYWEEQVEIQFVAANAWVAFASGRREEGISQLRAAAKLEGTTNKNVVTPGPLAPARELLAEMLLDAGQSADARAEFEQVLKTEPNRFRSVFGAARAAELAGDLPGAKEGYSDLLQIAAKSDTDRPELQMARAFVAGH
jgi:tetratricopeptide (TPR) repeat protein